MKRFLVAAGFLMILSRTCGTTQAGDKDARIVIDKAIKAMGGEERLVKAEVATSKTKVKFLRTASESTTQITEEGADRMRAEVEQEANGQIIKQLTVLNGVKGWRKTRDGVIREMDQDAVLLTKRNRESLAAVTRPVILKSPRFLVQLAGEAKVEDKPTVVLDVIGSHGQDFKIFFDKESSLPVKLETKVSFPNGRESAMETTFANYKDFDRIKVATKSEQWRDGKKSAVELEIIEFKILEKVAPGTFDEPK
jgi:hypothetical protein